MKTTDDVVRYLRDIQRRSDERALPRATGIFARAYHRVTLEVIARMADGFFEDPSWLAEFDVRFAALYRAAIERPGDRPRSWQVAFAEAGRGEQFLMRHLLLGINAHMRYDLCAVLLGGFVEPHKREGRRRDFYAVNRAMRLAVGPIQQVLHEAYGSWLRRADALGLGVDEILTYERFVEWRGRAWQDAMDIYDGKLTLREVDARVARDARALALLPL
jgi:hypothetical protein